MKTFNQFIDKDGKSLLNNFPTEIQYLLGNDISKSEKLEVKIFNKWGNLLFSSIGEYTPWAGTYNGEPLPSEVYYYIIELKNDLDNKYTGTLTIIR